MNLSFGISFEDLYSTAGIAKIHALYLKTTAPLLEGDGGVDSLIEEARHLEDFIAELFNIRSKVAKLKSEHEELTPIYLAKKLFVQRQMKKYLAQPRHPEIVSGSGDYNPEILKQVQDDELLMSKAILKAMDESDEENLISIAHYLNDNPNKFEVLTKLPKKLDFENLVHNKGCKTRNRESFSLTDDGGSLNYALDQANYCIYCHPRGKDSCSKGIWEEATDNERATSDPVLDTGEHEAIEADSHAALELKPKTSPTNTQLAGCPLDEKISEMNLLKASGNSIAALAVVTIDNPMCAATGHRICNDCMKSCIYQKQEPVDIPQVESKNIRDVLSLPYGFEIYSLLTRWNPLNKERPVPKADSDKKILVVGLGPAGFTLAHHLLNDGHSVYAIDGLKIEPQEIKTKIPFEPIKDSSIIWEDLNKRQPQGFGGVAEYGITVRWDKNFLTIIRLLLERRANFAFSGGTRFGSNITAKQAYAMGFDHIAMCAGAGKPNIIPMKNALAKGVRMASDFLMTLQSGGAFLSGSITNLTVRAPIIVIGGGLTAIDTATEAQTYYKTQCEKFKKLYAKYGEKLNLNEEEKIIAEELLSFNPSLTLPSGEGITTKTPLPEGGVGGGFSAATILYRKRLQDSPAYRLNHEEVEKAFEEGIEFIENATPIEVILDEFDAAKAIKIMRDGKEEIIPARTILMAAGTQPNTVLAREEDGYDLDGKYFQMLDEQGDLAKPTGHCKPQTTHVLMQDKMSFFGDLHPDFAGNVVKAMASAKRGYPVISKILDHQPSTTNHQLNFLSKIKSELSANVHLVKRLTPNIIEIVVKAPLAAKNFEPGQFYKLQNYSSAAYPEFISGSNNKIPKQVRDMQNLVSEPLAMTGAWVDKEKGLLGMVVLEMGGSSNLYASMKTGEDVVLMGPTGTPTEIPKDETVILCGGGLGNAVLLSIGKAMRENGCKVIYFAGYKKAQDRYKTQEIEDACDQVIWCCDEKADFDKNREKDAYYTGNIVQAMQFYAQNLQNKANYIKLQDADRIIAIGSDKMMKAITYARHNELKEFLSNCKTAIGSINSPMQCMMKEICAQCLQRHVDPKTGAESYVYSCFNQDQCLDNVDFDHLDSRLKQNSLQEKLTAQVIAAKTG